jgi:hypothetical protein
MLGIPDSSVDLMWQPRFKPGTLHVVGGRVINLPTTCFTPAPEEKSAHE